MEPNWSGSSFEMVSPMAPVSEEEKSVVVVVELDGREVVEPPKDEAWEEANEMQLMNSKISNLPCNPNCPKLCVLFLQGNPRLRAIPPSFFQCMPILQILDLSHTKIKYLPQSFFDLVQLRKFFLRSCTLFNGLPIDIGELVQLEVLDMEETDIPSLPVSIGKLTNLSCLKVSLYYNQKKQHSDTLIIPQNVISNLLQLEELTIDVDPGDKRWNVTTLKDTVKEFCGLKLLHSLKLHLPDALLLNEFSNGSSSLDLSCMRFRFTVGRCNKFMIPQPSDEYAIKFEEEESSLKYVNGDDQSIPTEIKEVLQHASALFVHRNLTLTSLSEFGTKNMKNLKFCALNKCKGFQTIVDADADAYNGNIIFLGSLEYLYLRCMTNLRSIWKGPPLKGSLPNLKVLELHACLELTTIFASNLLYQLCNLEELVVEICLGIQSIVSHEVVVEDVAGPQEWFLPKLKKMSVHYLPRLVSIWGVLPFAPELEWLSFYDCPNLKILCPEEVSSCKLEVIIGEADWWNELKWNVSKRFQPPKLDAIFVPIERYADLRTQLVEIEDRLQIQKQKTEHSQQSGYFPILSVLQLLH